jgi:hypothetical protein
MEGDAGTGFGELVGLVVARIAGVADDLLERDGATLELRKLVEDFVGKGAARDGATPTRAGQNGFGGASGRVRGEFGGAWPDFEPRTGGGRGRGVGARREG